MPGNIPTELQLALERLAAGKPRRELMQRAKAISQSYRSGAPSRETIRSADDALAYAFTRMPATYAATSAVLAAVREACPDFAPRTLVDAGAGPGSAAFAAAQEFVTLGPSLLIDDNPHLRALGLVLARIRALRAHLIAQGAHALAPCPHDLPCPIVDPDRCHFAQRLPRSRDHRQVKGAALAFEDEKFSYVALARAAAAGQRARAGASARRQGRGRRQAVHVRWNRRDDGEPARRKRVQDTEMLALGRRRRLAARPDVTRNSSIVGKGWRVTRGPAAKLPPLPQFHPGTCRIRLASAHRTT